MLSAVCQELLFRKNMFALWCTPTRCYAPITSYSLVNSTLHSKARLNGNVLIPRSEKHYFVFLCNANTTNDFGAYLGDLYNNPMRVIFAYSDQSHVHHHL